MGPATRARISAGLWLAPLVVLIHLMAFEPQEASGEGYRLAVATKDGFNILMTGSVAALAGAWEGSRLRRGRVLVGPRRRSAWQVGFWPWACSAAVPVLAGLAVFGADRVLGHPEVVVPTLVILGVDAFLGLAVGLSTPRAVGLPVSFLAPVLVMLFAPASSVLWMRHLTGAWPACCSSDGALDPRVVGASMVAALGVSAGCVCLVVRHCRGGGARTGGRAWIGAAGGSVAAALIVASFMVHTVAPAPEVPRSGDLVCRTTAGGEVCVWPEHRDILDTTVRVLSRAAPVWRAGGARLPARWTESRDSDGVPLVLSSGSRRPDDVVRALARGLVPDSCLGREGVTDDPAVVGRHDRLLSWLVLSGYRANDLSGNLAGPSGLDPAALEWARGVVDGSRGIDLSDDFSAIAGCR